MITDRKSGSSVARGKSAACWRCWNKGARITSPWWFGEKIGHADIAVACVLRFTSEAHPQLFDDVRYPALAAHAARCEAMPVFAEITQPLIPPSG
jgi:glutathione S-transferase